VSWSGDETLEPSARYAALRRLEELGDREAVVDAAVRLLDENDEFLRVNAIAVLTRTDTDRARAALAKRPERDQRLAETLTRHHK
jgi:HEAT repeat protein